MLKHVLISGLMLSLLTACASAPQSGTAAKTPAQPAAATAPQTKPAPAQQSAAADPNDDPLMTQVKQADAANDWPKLETLLRQLMPKYPDDWELPFMLGTTQLR